MAATSAGNNRLPRWRSLNKCCPRRARRPQARSRATSRSSWTATAAGRRRGCCRGSRAIAAASRRCAARCAACRELGIGYLTLYSFSSENWSRPPDEVGDLMGLIRRFIRNDLADLHANNVRVRIIGMREGLDPDIRAMLQEAESLTANNTGLMLVFAFNYGARQEILAAVRQAASAIAAGELDPDALDAGDLRPLPRHRRDPGPRPDHPHLGRAAPVELPAVAGGLCRVRVHAGAVAGLRPRRARSRRSPSSTAGNGASAAGRPPARREGPARDARDRSRRPHLRPQDAGAVGAGARPGGAGDHGVGRPGLRAVWRWWRR